MEFAVDVNLSNGTPVVALRGELDLAAADTFMDVVEPVLAASPPSLRLDLADLRFIDSTGISSFVRVARSLEPAGRLVLVAPTQTVERVLDLVRLDTLANVEIERVGAPGDPGSAS